MKKKKIANRLTALLLAAVMLIPSNVTSFATEANGQSSTTVQETNSDAKDSTAEQNSEAQSNTQNSAAAESKTETNSEAQSSAEQNNAAQNTTTQNSTTEAGAAATNNDSSSQTDTTQNNSTSENPTGNVTGEVTNTNVTGDVIVDENNDKVEIKKNDKPYLALGADLSEEQRSTVLSLMGIDPANLSNYEVVSITNSEEHQYLDSYVEASKIGSKSWSSVVIVERAKGNGLNISTKNINYCTVGMYKNALTTAGITDADIIVAGPKSISGTAALVGIFKAYEKMTGKEVQDNVVDAALNELVITGELEDSIKGLSNQEVEEFIAYIKSLIAEKNLTTESGINDAIDEACKKYDVTLTDEERQKIVDLLLKITSLGIDLSGLVDYASKIYDSFKNGGSSSGVLSAIGQFVGNIFSAIGSFFKSLFK